MTVTPYCNHLFQSPQDLYRFLIHCSTTLSQTNSLPIVSISLEIAAVDPLIVLQQLAQNDQPSFYFQKQNSGYGELAASNNDVAIAAIGTTIALTINGSNRFKAAKKFIQTTLENTVLAGDLRLPFAGPHFFCSFAFSDHSCDATTAFPAATLFLPTWQISCCENRCTIVVNITVDDPQTLQAKAETYWQTLQRIRSIHYELVTPVIHHDFLTKQDVAHPNHFRTSVQSALHWIQAGTFHKIVLAHAVDLRSPFTFDPIEALHNLRRLYSDCYIFAIGNGQGQHFLGASPERLVSLRDRQLNSDALAGSAPRGQTACEDARFANRLLHSPKETHEHQVVVDFISQQLIELGIVPQPSPLRLLQLSNIQHLHTPIRATVPADIHLLDIVATLHPTPAVAGMPREIACEMIHRYEPFERSLYAAPIGWVDHHGNGEFAVGIRSALLNGCTARLFAGAGIVAGSDPDHELAEVQLKLQALSQALV